MSRMILVTAIMGATFAVAQQPAPSVQPQITTPQAAPTQRRPAIDQKPTPKPDVAALKKRAEAGDIVAADQLADAYSMGVMGFRDLAEASVWYRKAAEAGSLKAQTKLAMMLEGGFGVARDPKQALQWYEKAAEQNETNSMMRLANAYMEGMESENSSVEKNPALALKWFAKAAELGVAQAQISMGEFYKQGIASVLQPDYAVAMKWYLMAADQNDPTGLYYVGRMYEEGKGVPVSTAEAKKWYELALKRGSPEARNAIRRLQY